MQGLLADRRRPTALPGSGGLRAVIAGSCSSATQQQVALMREHHPAFHIDPLELRATGTLSAQRSTGQPPASATSRCSIYATARPEEVKAVQAQLGVEEAGELVEEALAAVARGLVDGASAS